MLLSGEKMMSLNFSQSLLMRYLSNLQVTRTGIKARNEFEIGPDRLHVFSSGLFALHLEKMMYPSFLIYSEFNVHQI